MMKSHRSRTFTLLFLLILPLASLYAVSYDLPRVNLSVDIPASLSVSVEGQTSKAMYGPYGQGPAAANPYNAGSYGQRSGAYTLLSASSLFGGTLRLAISTNFSPMTSEDRFPSSYSINQRNQQAKAAMSLIGADPATFREGSYRTYFAEFPCIGGEFPARETPEGTEGEARSFRYYSLNVENNSVIFLFVQDGPFTDESLATIESILSSVRYTFRPDSTGPAFGYGPGQFPTPQPGSSSISFFTDFVSGVSFPIPSGFTPVHTTPTGIILVNPAEGSTLTYTSKDYYQTLPYYTQAIYTRPEINTSFFTAGEIARSEGVPIFLISRRILGSAEYFVIDRDRIGYPAFGDSTLTYLTYRNGYELRFTYSGPSLSPSLMDRLLSAARFS